MSETWYFLDSGPGEPAFNMGLDESLLEAVATIGCPVFRVYTWARPAATFGYFQRYAHVEGLTAVRPLVRRPTGGGLVIHRVDYTYSLVFPPSHPWHSLRATESYRRVHEWIVRALAILDVPAELSAQPQREALGQCFLSAEVSDVLRRGRKIAGAAQRRNRNGLLIQGSIQPLPLKVTRQRMQVGMRQALTGTGAIDLAPFVPSSAILQRGWTLAQDKYGQAHYNERR